jgi:hypothetical protein
MNNKVLGRLISIGILAIIAACVIHIDHTRQYEMGREAFLAKKAAFYDHNYAHPDSTFHNAILSLFILGILYAPYELIAFVALKVLERINADDSNG